MGSLSTSKQVSTLEDSCIRTTLVQKVGNKDILKEAKRYDVTKTERSVSE